MNVAQVRNKSAQLAAEARKCHLGRLRFVYKFDRDGNVKMSGNDSSVTLKTLEHLQSPTMLPVVINKL